MCKVIKARKQARKRYPPTIRYAVVKVSFFFVDNSMWICG